MPRAAGAIGFASGAFRVGPPRVRATGVRYVIEVIVRSGRAVRTVARVEPAGGR